MQERITNSYIHALQAVYHDIDNRGIMIDREAIDEAKIFVDQEINRNLAICYNQWHCHVFVGGANALPKSHPDASNQVNINSTKGEKALLTKLQNLGYKVPKIPKRNEDGEYEATYSTGELALQKMLVTNQFNFPGGDPAIRAILQVRELTKLRSSYLNCRFYQSPSGLLYYLSHYNCAGTLTGRRSSKKHTFGYGGNGQNFPSHGRFSDVLRRIYVARPGNIFLSVDQKGAEEWPVNALAENLQALDEMRSGVNRHIRRAARIFGIQESIRSEKEWKKSNEYYLGKKTGHANNYGMKETRMSDSLAQEGYSIPPKDCANLLERLNILEPQIRGVFHVKIRAFINKTRILVTPFGRERQFLGLRPNDNNYKLFNEAYSWIPQSVVGDNNGFAVYNLETSRASENRSIVQEGHDSIVQDIPATADRIWRDLQGTGRAYERTVRFDSGIEFVIPTEAEIGYNFRDKVKIQDWSYDGCVKALKECNLMREQEQDEKLAKLNLTNMSNLAINLPI